MTSTLSRLDGNQSPFDAIRQIRDDGAEFWSARDLMPLLGYGADWRNFVAAIDRARATAANTGAVDATLFVGVTENSGGRPREDCQLSRYAAYLVAMNGDPRKPEVAVAQAYFAIRTREAEVGPRRELSRLELIDLARDAEIDRLEAERRAALAETRAAELEAPAAHAETFRAADGLCTIGDLANRLQIWAATNRPDVKIRHQDVWDHAGRIGIVIRGNTVRHNQPTSQAIKAGWARAHRAEFDTHTRGMQTTVTTRLTSRGEARLWDACLEWLNTHDHLSLKELTA